MKLLMYLLIFSTLNASIFASNDDSKAKENILEKFRQNVIDTNSIIRHGKYDMIPLHQSNVSFIVKQVENLEISQENKTQLKKDLLAYAKLVNTIGTNLKEEAPILNVHYQQTIDELQKFNKKISNIGLYALTSQWMELSKIKNNFVKKPNFILEKKFEDTWNAIVVTITELYLDEDVENPLFNYLDHYKFYFKEISKGYNRADYKNINKLKPLNYKIKAELEML